MNDYKINILSIIKVFFFFILLQIIISFGLILLSNFNSSFSVDFQNKWNNSYISGNSKKIIDIVKENNIINSKVKKCKIDGFYKEKNILYFCKDLRIFQFNKNNLTIDKVLTNISITELLYIGLLISINALFITIIVLSFNNIYFRNYIKIKSYNRDEKQRELDTLYGEIKEDIINNTGISQVRLSGFSLKAYQLLINEKQLYKEYYYGRLRKLGFLAQGNGMEKEFNEIKRNILKIEKEHSTFISRIEASFHYLIFKYCYISPLLLILISIFIIITGIIGIYIYNIMNGNLEIANITEKTIDFSIIKSNISLQIYLIVMFLLLLLTLVKNIILSEGIKSLYKIK